jgi:hypothetical protein
MVVRMLSEDVKLTNLEALIAGCWITAERETVAEVLEEHRRPAEEPLTFLFSGKLRKAVATARRSGNIEATFLKDLGNFIPFCESYVPQA